MATNPYNWTYKNEKIDIEDLKLLLLELNQVFEAMKRALNRYPDYLELMICPNCKRFEIVNTWTKEILKV